MGASYAWNNEIEVSYQDRNSMCGGLKCAENVQRPIWMTLVKLIEKNRVLANFFRVSPVSRFSTPPVNGLRDTKKYGNVKLTNRTNPINVLLKKKNSITKLSGVVLLYSYNFILFRYPICENEYQDTFRPELIPRVVHGYFQELFKSEIKKESKKKRKKKNKLFLIRYGNTFQLFPSQFYEKVNTIRWRRATRVCSPNGTYFRHIYSGVMERRNSLSSRCFRSSFYRFSLWPRVNNTHSGLSYPAIEWEPLFEDIVPRFTL